MLTDSDAELARVWASYGRREAVASMGAEEGVRGQSHATKRWRTKQTRRNHRPSVMGHQQPERASHGGNRRLRAAQRSPARQARRCSAADRFRCESRWRSGENGAVAAGITSPTARIGREGQSAARRSSPAARSALVVRVATRTARGRASTALGKTAGASAAASRGEHSLRTGARTCELGQPR